MVWYKNNGIKMTKQQLKVLTSQYGLKQVINQFTHILNNSSSCADFLFISQCNLVKESGVYRSLHSNCHHQIIYARFNQNIYHPPPMSVKSGIIKKRILIWFSNPFVNLTGKGLFIERTLKRKCPFSIIPLIMYFRISFPTKP